MRVGGKQPDRQAEVNTWVGGAFAGAMVGFIIAIVLGAIAFTPKEGVTNWLSGIGSVGAALVSSFAVLLVSKTLKATQDTMHATVRMAEEQERHNEAQLRPWLYLVSIEFKERRAQGALLCIAHIKNFGASPARNIKVKQYMEWGNIEEGAGLESPTEAPAPKETRHYTWAGSLFALAPGSTYEYELITPPGFAAAHVRNMDLTIDYLRHDGSPLDGVSYRVHVFDDEEQGLVQIDVVGEDAQLDEDK